MHGWNKFLIAVDNTETSHRALQYFGHVSGCANALEILLLHVYPDPPPDFFSKGGNLSEYRRDQEAAAAAIFKKSREILSLYLGSDIAITDLAAMTDGDTISQKIVKIQKENGIATVVVGKRGVSKAEEFLFGSISNSVVRNVKEGTVWVVG